MDSKKKALFLDRDGVINVDTGYAFKQEQIIFIDGIFEFCRLAKSLGYYLIIITNQSGIGRGLYSKSDFTVLMSWMKKIFKEENCEIHDVYFCPYHPHEGKGKYKRKSSWRKPGPGMIKAAAKQHNIDVMNSVIIGDSYTDIEAGLGAGVKWRLILTNGGAGPLLDKGSHVQVESLYAAINFLLHINETYL